jgi:hypothetical protein
VKLHYARYLSPNTFTFLAVDKFISVQVDLGYHELSSVNFPALALLVLLGLPLLTFAVKQFIKEVRKAKTLQDERSVVQKESAAIRASFREESGDQSVRLVLSVKC